MSDLTERLRRIATTPSGYVSISRDELIEAADRIDELEAALLRSAVSFNDYDDGSGGYYRCQVCNCPTAKYRRNLAHKDDCLLRALEADHE